MNIKVILTAKRPNTNAEFWWNATTDNARLADLQTIKECGILNIQDTKELSEDGLTLTRTFTNVTHVTWGLFMDIVLSQYELLMARREYFLSNNHTLSKVKINVDTNEIVEQYADVIAYLT